MMRRCQKSLHPSLSSSTHRLPALVATFAIFLLAWVPAARAATLSPELERSLRLEVDAVGEIVQQIDGLLSATQRGEVSPEATAAHREATAEYKEARTLIEARKYEQGYEKLRAAKKSAMVAARELVAKGVAVPIDKLVARGLEVGASRVQAVAELLKGKSTPQATAAYQEGEKLYQRAKGQYSAGDHRDAYETLDAALLKLDEAIRALWKAKGPK